MDNIVTDNMLEILSNPENSPTFFKFVLGEKLRENTANPKRLY